LEAFQSYYFNLLVAPKQALVSSVFPFDAEDGDRMAAADDLSLVTLPGLDDMDGQLLEKG